MYSAPGSADLILGNAIPSVATAGLWPVAAVLLAILGLGLGLALGRRRSSASMEALTRRAQAQLWTATVTREGEILRWSFQIPPSGLFEQIFGSPQEFEREHPWRHVLRGEKDAMDKRSREAILSGAPGYSQEFPLERAGRRLWLQEHVTIQKLGEDRWSLVGVITDATRMHEEQERLRERDRLVIHTLARADCLLWWANVRVEDQTVKWLGFDMPTSALYRRLFGERDASAGGRLWSLLEVPDLSAMNARSTQAILSGAGGYEQEFRAYRGDEAFWLHEQVTIAPAGPGEYRLVGVIMDVSAVRSAVEARRASEVQIEHLLSRADCLLWQARVTRAEGGRLQWALHVPSSSLHRRLFGAESGERPQLPWERIVPAEACDLMGHKAQDAILSNAPGYEQDIYARPNGQEFWLHERVNIQLIHDGEWHLVGAIFDVTELHRAEAALGAEKERLAVTLAAMSDAVISTDASGRVLYANRAAGALLGRDADGLVGRHATQVCRFVDEGGRPVPAPVDEVCERDATVALPSKLHVLGEEDRKIAVEGSVAPVHNPGGRVVGVVMVLRDVTERERLEQEIARASKLQSVGLLAGGIAHDFNNLLTVILGNVAVIKQATPGEGEVAACLGEAERAVIRARDLTQQLLTFARGGDPVRSAVQLNETIVEAAGFGVRGSAVRCEFDFAPDLWPADVDRGQIAQVVQNLVLNGVQAMPGGGVIHIRAENVSGETAPANAPSGNFVCITIVDTGAGIAAENLPRIFDPYFTTKSEGSGLGLATVYSIVKKHRGVIEVDSQPGRGTTFRVFLPAAARGAVARSPAPVVSPQRLRGRILLMDDEEPIRKVGGRMLSRLGLAVETAPDGATAVEIFRAARDEARPFDVVMVDLTVPGGMGGLEAFRRMREIDPDVRGVVSSGYSNDMVMGDYRAHGFVGMIPKPYRIDDCARILAEVLGLPDAS